MFFAINAKRSRAWLSSAFYLRIEEKKIIKTFSAKGLSTLQLRTIHRRDQLLRSHILVVHIYTWICAWIFLESFMLCLAQKEYVKVEGMKTILFDRSRKGSLKHSTWYSISHRRKFCYVSICMYTLIVLKSYLFMNGKGKNYLLIEDILLYSYWQPYSEK